MRLGGAVLAALLLALTFTPAHADIRPATPDRLHIVTAGDSITEGVGAPARDSYPRQLERMCDGCEVTNVGHGGSCLAAAGCGYGKRLVDTFRSEVLSQHPDVVVVGIGRNDLCHLTLGEFKAGFRNLRDQAKRADVEILFNTISPDNSRWLWPCEPQRREVNRWLRSSHLSVVDVSAALSTSAGRLPSRFDSGDGCHPGSAGYSKIAGAVESELAGRMGR